MHDSANYYQFIISLSSQNSCEKTTQFLFKS